MKNMHGGTVLGTAAWPAINEPRTDHISIIEALLRPGARIEAADHPSGDARVDDVLRRDGATCGTPLNKPLHPTTLDATADAWR